MPSCSQATTTNASRTRRRKADNTRRRARMAATGTRWRPFSCHARISKPPRRHGVRRAETLATDTAERLPAATRCAPADSRKHRIGQPRGLSRQAANPKRSRSLLAARHDLERHPDMAASLRKQLVDRRRVVHGIAPGREQVEHGGSFSSQKATYTDVTLSKSDWACNRWTASLPTQTRQPTA